MAVKGHDEHKIAPENFPKKYSNKLSMKALVEWKYVVFDSIFRIQAVLEWVFREVIFRSSCF